MASSKRVTGVAYDSCLESHYSLWNKEYTEHPLRTKVCIERCEQLGLLSRCKRIPVREATLDEINVCHSKEQFDLLHRTEFMDEVELQELSQCYDYIYFHKDSFRNARLALGATIDLVEEIVSEKIANGMAIVRPPGHHAMKDEFNGYCYFNNVAVATQLMLDRHGLERIIVLDWDVHHGQGLQYLFYNDPRVLYISIHRYEYGNEWPCLRESDYDFIGEGAGKGFNINLPLNEIGCGNDDYLSLFFHVILPICREYNPQLILVSAGFDSAIGCPEGEMCITPACFPHFINLLTPLASGKMALVLEGGYNMRSLAESAALSLRSLLGNTTPSISPIAGPRLCVTELILCAVKVLWPYWQSLRIADIVDRKEICDKIYPYPTVLLKPPKEGVHFDNVDSRPKCFPLIQECIGVGVSEKVEEAERMIDSLIQNTSLTSPALKLAVYHDGSNSSSHLFQLLQEELESNQLWEQCHTESASTASEGNVHPLQSCVIKCVDSIVNNTLEAGIIITNLPDSTIANGKMEEKNPAIYAIKHAMTTSNTKRIILLQIVDDDDSLAGLQEPMLGVLKISILLSKCEGNDQTQASCMHKDSRSTSQIDPTNIHIPFCNKSTTDADILSAFYFIILPICYEFSPDFVIFSWNTKTQMKASGMQTITQYVSGLAQGKILTLVNHQSSASTSSSLSLSTSIESTTPFSSSTMHETSTSLVVPDSSAQSENVYCQEKSTKEESENEKLFINCVMILFHKKCLPFSDFHMSERGISVIKQTLNSIKHLWKSLVFKDQVPNQT